MPEQKSLLGVAVLFLSVLLLFFFLLGRYRKREIQRLQNLLQGRIPKDEARRLLNEKLGEKDLEIVALIDKNSTLEKRLSEHEANIHKILKSNLSSIPWLAGMMADFLTYDIEMKAKYLDWGSDQRRLKKVESIRDIRFDAKNRIQQAKEAIYQLEYLKTLYPALEDVLSTDYKDLNFTGQIPEHDPARDYLSAEEWARLSDDEKNQLAPICG